MPRAPGVHGAQERRAFYQDQRREEHRARLREADRYRPNSAARGYDHKWRAYREGYLLRNPLCVACAEQDALTGASVVDHITPHKGDRRLFWDPANHQPLCKPCHDRKTWAEASGADTEQVYWPEGLKPSRPPLTIVSGPPAAGKSTYVRTHASPGHVVIDVDEIAFSLCGRSAKRADIWSSAVMREALRERNRRLRALAQSEAAAAWFIVTAARAEHRDWWAKRLEPLRRVVCYAPRSVCERRIDNAPDRTETASMQKAAVKRWHAAFTYSAADEIVKTG